MEIPAFAGMTGRNNLKISYKFFRIRCTASIILLKFVRFNKIIYVIAAHVTHLAIGKTRRREASPMHNPQIYPEERNASVRFPNLDRGCPDRTGKPYRLKGIERCASCPR